MNGLRKKIMNDIYNRARSKFQGVSSVEIHKSRQLRMKKMSSAAYEIEKKIREMG